MGLTLITCGQMGVSAHPPVLTEVARDVHISGTYANILCQVWGLMEEHKSYLIGYSHMISCVFLPASCP